MDEEEAIPQQTPITSPQMPSASPVDPNVPSGTMSDEVVKYHTPHTVMFNEITYDSPDNLEDSQTSELSDDSQENANNTQGENDTLIVPEPFSQNYPEFYIRKEIKSWGGFICYKTGKDPKYFKNKKFLKDGKTTYTKLKKTIETKKVGLIPGHVMNMTFINTAIERELADEFFVIFQHNPFISSHSSSTNSTSINSQDDDDE